jgi:hypothetical protein
MSGRTESIAVGVARLRGGADPAAALIPADADRHRRRLEALAASPPVESERIREHLRTLGAIPPDQMERSRERDARARAALVAAVEASGRALVERERRDLIRRRAGLPMACGGGGRPARIAPAGRRSPR